MSLKKRISLDAQRTIQGAFDDLKDALSTTDFVQLKDTTLDDVQQSIYKIEEYLCARGVVKNLTRLLPLITGLGHYAKTIEVICNGTPYLAWIWAPIKLILKVSSENLDAFEQIIKTYASIAQPFARFKTYNAMYPKDLDVQKALSLFYADILRFHKNAYNLVRRGGWHILFATSCGRFHRQFQHIFDDLKAHEALIDKTANAAGLQDIRSLLESMQLDQDARKEAAARKEEELVASQLAQIITLLRVDDSHQLDLLETILSKAGEVVGSGGWAIKQPKIQSWASRTEQTKFLVLHGHPGTGKSVLSARIARFLQLLVNAVVIAHFCTYIYPESTRYEDLLRFILLRLIRKSPELITYAYYDLFVRKWAPSSAVLEELLIRLLSAAGTSQSQTTYIHLIVDGLNECSENIQTRVFKFLQKLVASASSQIVLKVLLVTRTDETNSAISKALKGKHQVSLAEEKDQLREDIRLYVQSALGTLRPKLRDLRLDDKDTDCLSTQIVDRADGMILWAKLVLQSISLNFLYSREEVFESAKTFPRELSKLYGQMLARTISGFDDRSSSRFRSVLGWIAFARRPLRHSELLSALSFSSNEQDVTHVVPSYILGACAPLVEKRADTTYGFIHVSVREFLLVSDSPMQLSEHLSRHEQGMSILRCLLAASRVFNHSCPEDTRVQRVVRGVYAFVLYAADFWLDGLLYEFDASNQAGSTTVEEFLMVSSDLATALGCSSSVTPDTAGPLQSSQFGSLLGAVQKYGPALSSMTKAAIQSRTKTSLDPGNPQVPVENLDPRSVEQLKTKYQLAIRELLRRRTCGRMSITEFEWFKHEARHGAFTCRLPSCRNALLGFENERLLLSHESEHVGHICPFSGCQHRPVTALENLKRHIKEHHEMPPSSKSNRRSVRSGIRSQGPPSVQQSPQAANMAQTQAITGGQMAIGQNAMQRAQPPQNMPPHLMQVSAQDLAQIRASKPQFQSLTDEHLRTIVLAMKKNAWQQRQSILTQQNQGQGQNQANVGQIGTNMLGQAAGMNLQPPMQAGQNPQAQRNQNSAGQTTPIQGTQQKGPEQANNRNINNKKPQAQPTPSPAQGPKSLKRPNSDEADASAASQNQKPMSAQGQGQTLPQLSQDDIANMKPDQRLKFEQMRRAQMAAATQGTQLPQAAQTTQASQNTQASQAAQAPTNAQSAQSASESLARLKLIGQEEQRSFQQQAMPDIPMTPQELLDTSQRLQRMVGDMSKIGRGFSKWYSLTQDDHRARLFFRTRLRILKQFADGEGLTILRESFSIHSAELDQARAMLESMAKDLARSVFGRNMMKTQQGQNAGQKPTNPLHGQM